MYFQVFFHNSDGSVAQVSCDNWAEVQDEVAKRHTKKVVVRYFNQNGLVGMVTKYRKAFTKEYFSA